MSILGNTPEKRQYNKAVLIFAACFLVTIFGFAIRSIAIILIGFALAFLVGVPIMLIAKEEYYSVLFKKFRKVINKMRGKSKETPYEEMQQKIEEKKEPKESPWLPLMGGAIIVIVFSSLYLINRKAELYPIIFRNITIVGVLIFGYGIFRYFKNR